jgi:hypothetical protein
MHPGYNQSIFLSYQHTSEEPEFNICQLSQTIIHQEKVKLGKQFLFLGSHLTWEFMHMKFLKFFIFSIPSFPYTSFPIHFTFHISLSTHHHPSPCGIDDFEKSKCKTNPFHLGLVSYMSDSVVKHHSNLHVSYLKYITKNKKISLPQSDLIRMQFLYLVHPCLAKEKKVIISCRIYTQTLPPMYL